jgi:hypothetical protein
VSQVLSIRIDDADLALYEQELGVARSEVLRQALRLLKREVVRWQFESSYRQQPLTAAERAEIASWTELGEEALDA